jgi:diguanylate cyclase (GGDEF)-like protein
MGEMLSSQQPPPSVRRALIVGADEWWGDALESILAPAGYDVVHAADDAPVPAVGAGGEWHIILVGSPQADAVETCRRLRHDATIAAGTPVIILSAAPALLEHRVAGLHAGAWDVLAFPLNAQELVARIDGFVSVKVEADRARTDGLLDSVSGLYAVRGIEYRARELLAEAERHHLSLACVVLGVDPKPEQDAPDGARALQHVAQVLRTHGRLSDVIGRWGETEFAVLAPGTRAIGAARLAQRLAWLVETRTLPGSDVPPVRVRGGFEAVDDAGATRVRAQDLLTRADTAFQTACIETSLPHIRQYSAAMSHEGRFLHTPPLRGQDSTLLGGEPPAPV